MMRGVSTISWFILLVNVVLIANSLDLPSCDSPIYCQGDLLDVVQMAQIYPDSKTFVDMNLVKSVNETLTDFQELMETTNQSPTKEEITDFVNEHFEAGADIDQWTPPDYTDTPEFLERIPDPLYRQFAQDLVKIWPSLARKVKREVAENPDQYSLIFVENGFIVPGGRFQEFYYWDSYWIVQGLLVSEMYGTVKGMLENFLSIVERFGFIPNGSRVYYLNRSQPPLLTAMIANYLRFTQDSKFIEDHIETIDKELSFWLENRFVEIDIKGEKFHLAHYDSESGSPRPESYYEDVTTGKYYKNEDEKKEFYKDIKSTAESGVDFSSRWIFDEEGGNDANLTFTRTRRVIPVDLNSFLCQAFHLITGFYEDLGNVEKVAFWEEKALILKSAIGAVFYHEEDGIWYDWDPVLNQHRRFFYPTNFAPLWTGCYNVLESEKLGDAAAAYALNMGLKDFMGGIPASLDENGEQWDYPNAWPPHQALVIQGLLNTDSWFALDTGVTFMERWLTSNMIGFNKTGIMFEKYDAEVPGQYGGGGEYQVQEGFGWTNGLALELIHNHYASDKKDSK